MNSSFTPEAENRHPGAIHKAIPILEMSLSEFLDLENLTAWTPPDPALEKVYALKKQATAWIQQYGKKPTLSPATEAEYRKKAQTLNHWRPEPNDPPDIEAHVSTPSSFYAYRAALIWDAIQRLKEARRQLDRTSYKSPDWKAALLQLRTALMDLDLYPMDRQGKAIQRHRQNKTLHAVGLTDAPAVSAFTRARQLGQTKAPSTDKGKAWYASRLNRKLPDWRQRIFARLKQIFSPWLLHAAAASLTGCRPEELEGIRISLEPDGRLRFEIKGAKVSEQKGQPIRILTLRENCPEFEALREHCLKQGGEGHTFTLSANTAITNPAEAFGAAVKRAGNQALGKEYHFSAYCYRHALASDLKAEGTSREDLAVVLGHAVTETASCYGRHSGGRKQVRQIEAEGTRMVKVNHKAGPGQVRPPQNPASANGAIHDAIEPMPCSPK